MKKIELVYLEILYQCLERKNRKLTQAGLAKKLKISLSTVNHSLKPLKKMAAIEIKRRSFSLTDPKKILYYWASRHDLEKEIVYQTRVEEPVSRIEKQMPARTIYAAYSAYKFRFKEVPADYSEVYVYADEKEIKKRFPLIKKRPNLFVLKKERKLERYGSIAPLGLMFADLWNLKEWYAKEFLNALEVKINAILE